MAQTKLYSVLREHIGPGGELYSPAGALCTREAMPHEVAHLVPQTLVEIDAAAEAEKAAAEAQAAAEAEKAAAEAQAAKAPENKAAKPAKEVKEA